MINNVRTKRKINLYNITVKILLQIYILWKTKLQRVVEFIFLIIYARYGACECVYISYFYLCVKFNIKLFLTYRL